MLRTTTIVAITISFFFFLGMMSSAGAVTIDATKLDPAKLNINYWTGNETSNKQILAAIASIISSAQELYKQNYGGIEEGALISAYHTVFTGSSNATITWDGPSHIGTPSYILIKDGNSVPSWYLFDLNALGWDGTDVIQLINFWQGRGGISYVAIFGTPVPEPGILILLGIGMTAVGVASWYVRKI